MSLSGKLILSQESVIELQREVIRAKDDQLSTFQSTVKTSVEESVRSSVEESVKTEMKTYSTALSQSSHVEISQVELQQVVKAVVAEEDRSHKLILFGLLEQSSENLERTVGAVLLEIGEKPRIVAERIGRPSDNRVTRSSAKDHRGARPVLVTLQNGYTAGKILSRAKELKNSDRFQNVYISPDRTADQRNHQRKLVLELKERMKNDETRRHYITGGRVVSEDRPFGG